MILSNIPIWFVDLVGSAVMIVFSFLCLRLAYRLRNRDRNNVIWTYLLWVSYGLAGFAISRSAGHILKQVLFITGHTAIWDEIRPLSGSINTLTFVFVASVTLFFERVWIIYQQILRDKQALQSTRDELIYLNQNLESLVAERTEELALSEHKYRRIFEVSKDMILVTTRNGSIIDMNPASYQMLGYDATADNLTGKPITKFLAGESDWDYLRELIDKHGYISSTEIVLQHRQTHAIRSLVSGSMDRGPSDKEDTIHFLVKDIEKRQLAEEQIAQADKLASIGQLSAGIAHEINNPLGIILGYTQLLIRNETPESETHQDLKTIEKHVRNCKTIVEDLLNFARTSAPQEDFIRIDTAIEDVLKFVQQHADLDRINIQKDFDSSVPPMMLDEKKIKQVFMNLIINASHALDQKGNLSLSTRLSSDGRQVIIKVRDNGHGIEKKNLSRIFDPFYTTKPTGEGTGLGLSVSYGIIKNHGGDIRVESKAGHGSTFTIILPVTTAAQRDNHAKIHSDRR
jgi:PAS domain S-box-containing protein